MVTFSDSPIIPPRQRAGTAQISPPPRGTVSNPVPALSAPGFGVLLDGRRPPLGNPASSWRSPQNPAEQAGGVFGPDCRVDRVEAQIAARRERDRQADTHQRFLRRLFGPECRVDADGGTSWINGPRFGSCGMPMTHRVAVGRSQEGNTIFGGVETCGNATICMKCGRKVRAERATNIGEVLRQHLDADGGALFLTATMAHAITDSATASIDDALKAWKVMVGRSKWRNTIDEIGVSGWIKTLEVTHSMVNGYHPHFHVILLLQRPVGQDPEDLEELVEIRERLFGAWLDALQSKGRTAELEVGLDLRAVRDDAGIGEYVSKIEFEVARGDLKRSAGESRSMWQVAVDAAAGCEQSTAIYCEYVRAIQGRRWISTSRGLWTQYGIDDSTDEELAEEVEEFETVTFVANDLYRALDRHELPLLAELRHLIEADAELETIATVMTRRLDRHVTIRYLPADDGVPTLTVTGS